MRSRFVALSAALFFMSALAGCSTQTQSLPVAPPFLVRAMQAGTGSWVGHIDASMGLAYLADNYTRHIYIFDRHGMVVGSLALHGVPLALDVDRQHNLWVLVRYPSHVFEYARGATQPERELIVPDPYPSDVTVCPGGTVYISNYGKGHITGHIDVYANGSDHVTDKLFAHGHGNATFGTYITCSTGGTVFWEVTGEAGYAGVVVFPNASKTGEYTFALPFGRNQRPCGIKADADGNLFVCDFMKETIRKYNAAGEPIGPTISGNISSDLSVSRNGDVVGAVDSNYLNGVTYTFPGGVAQNVYVDPDSGSSASTFGFAIDY